LEQEVEDLRAQADEKFWGLLEAASDAMIIGNAAAVESQVVMVGVMVKRYGSSCQHWQMCSDGVRPVRVWSRFAT
jgi:hypothetical protein